MKKFNKICLGILVIFMITPFANAQSPIDTVPPVPTVSSLPVIVSACSINLTAPTANDDVDGLVTATTINPTFYSTQGSYTVNWIYYDVSGNSTVQLQTIVINDTIAPIPDVLNLPMVIGTDEIILNPPTATDNCGGTIIGTTNDGTYFYCHGGDTVTWTFDDGNGNISTQVQIALVQDTLYPIALCHDTVVYLDSNGFAYVLWQMVDAGSYDNCDVHSIHVSPNVFTGANVGVTTTSLIVSDAAENISICYPNITVLDTLAPIPMTIILPDQFLYSTDANDLNAPNANDNVLGNIPGVIAGPGSFNVPGNYSVQWVYTDNFGNSTSQSQNVTVVDTTGPVPNLVSLPVILEQCGVLVNPPSATDEFAGSIIGTTTDPLNYTNQGTYTITWTFDDGNGNMTTQIQIVVINDDTAPEFIGFPSDITIPANNNGCSAVVTWISPNFHDNCSEVNFSADHYSGEVFPLGTTEVTYTITDESGNTNTQSFTVTVEQSLALDAIVYNETSGQDGGIDVTVTGGTPAYSFSWSNFATSEDVSGLSAGSYDVMITDILGCVIQGNYTIATNAGTEQESPMEFLIYPNPNNGIFTLEANDPVFIDSKIQIMDAKGSIVFNSRIEQGNTVFNVSHLPNGTYYIQIITKTSSITKKLLLVH